MYTALKFFMNVLFQKDKNILLVSFVKKLSKSPQNRVHPTPYKKKKKRGLYFGMQESTKCYKTHKKSKLSLNLVMMQLEKMEPQEE